MKSFIFVCLMLCLSGVAYAGLFDSVVSQVQQVAQTAQQQAAKKQAEQQQTVQQQATQPQATQQQVDQQQADQQQVSLQQVDQQQVDQQQVDQQQAAQQQAEQQQAYAADTERLKPFWGKEQPRLDEQIKQGRILKIKGLYLGMNIDEACTILNQKMGVETAVSKIQDFGLAPLTEVTIPNGYKCAGVYSNDNKQVVLIIISHQQVDTLFNTDGISGEDFSKKFMGAYNISEMKPAVIANSNAWQYISPDGYKVSIFENKNLMIEPAAKASEMKFD